MARQQSVVEQLRDGNSNGAAVVVCAPPRPRRCQQRIIAVAKPRIWKAKQMLTLTSCITNIRPVCA